jgi:hypothetical protein
MKDRKTYKILTLLGLLWCLPINRIYLGEKWGVRLITFNWFYFGAVTDLFYMDKRFDEAVTTRGYVNTTRRG